MSTNGKIYILAMISFLVGTSQYVISGILDKIANQLGISIEAAGQLITVYSLIYAIGTPILMALFAKMERRKLLLFSLSVFIVGNLMAVIAPGYSLFMVARIVMALSAGVTVVTVLSLAAKIAQPNKKASSIATVVMGFTASLIIGVPIGRFVASAYDWKLVFLGVAIFVLLALVVIIKTIPKTHGDQPIPLLQQIGMFKQPKIALALSITFFLMSGYGIVFTYLSPYLVQTTGMSDHVLSFALLILGIASLIGSKFGGFSADKWGITLTLKRGLVLNILSIILLTFITSSINTVIIILTLWSFAGWSSGATQQFNLATISPKSSDVLLGLNQSMMQLGFAFGAAIGGFAVSQISISSITWMGSIPVIISLIITFVLSQYLMTEKKARQSVGTQIRA
ncbi:MFS transporter [Bacillus sp. AFS017336]|uniref:MFS transporter n=1 Tax=Bacillus sp. AFS017336 TaxID=2033489 RepID=UPI000BEFE7A5|nr:MFS transporter [Bacillus sp. AFS017336]PEL07661.1 MFS transporter [Bacillus sp. AFS017336]